jgi:type 1 glutamine amidotransferase
MPDSPRKLFVHGAHRTVGVPSSAAAVEAWDGLPLPAAKPSTAPLDVVLIAGQADDRTAALADAVGRSLKQRLHARVVTSGERTADAQQDRPLPDGTDVVVLLGDTSTLDGEVLDAVARLTSAGRGLVSLGAVPDRRQMGRRFQWSVLGAQLVGSAQCATVEMEVEPGARLHPLGQRLDASAWTAELATGVLPLSADALVLLSAREGTQRKPAAWCRQHGRGRVFGTLLGSGGDLEQSAFLQLITAAVAWTSGRQPPTST